MRSISRMHLCLSLLVVLSQITGCSIFSASKTHGVSAIGLTPHEWADLSQPGEEHKLLAQYVGDWEVSSTFWSSPGVQGQSSKGHSRIAWILGGRFIQEDFHGDVAGEPYQGIGLMGYDSGAQEFKTMWLDSLNTAMTASSGRYNADTGTIELSSEVYDPLRSGIKQVASKFKFLSPDSYAFEMYDETPTGKKFKSLEMIYSRRVPQGKKNGSSHF